MFLRDIKNITFKNLTVELTKPDLRPAMDIWQADGITLDHVSVTGKPAGVDLLRLEKIKNLTISASPGLADTRNENTDKATR